MALQKEIVLNSGITTNYHKIKNVSYNFIESKAIVNIVSYVSKEIRDLDTIEDIQNMIQTVTDKMSTLNQEKDAELIVSLGEKLHDLYHKLNEVNNTRYDAGSSVIELDSIPSDITITNIYKVLKSTDLYSKAKKV